jgi:CheY-like chemotaxis protein
VAYRIVIADPSPSAQRAVQLAFPEPEFRLFAFEDGDALLDALEEIRPDAVLLSPSLPGRDPAEIGRFLRSRKSLKRVPLVLLKGSFEGLDAARGPLSDPDEIVAKPFDSERLTASVRGLIERKMGPSTIPEEPLWTGGNDGESFDGKRGRPSLPKDPGLPAGPDASPTPPPGPVDPALRDWIRNEFYGTEREIEKRVRVRVLADLKEWLAGDGKDGKGTV